MWPQLSFRGWALCFWAVPCREGAGCREEVLGRPGGTVAMGHG